MNLSNGGMVEKHFNFFVNERTPSPYGGCQFLNSQKEFFYKGEYPFLNSQKEFFYKEVLAWVITWVIAWVIAWVNN